jgi:hypothetical protein
MELLERPVTVSSSLCLPLYASIILEPDVLSRFVLISSPIRTSDLLHPRICVLLHMVSDFCGFCPMPLTSLVVLSILVV